MQISHLYIIIISTVYDPKKFEESQLPSVGGKYMFVKVNCMCVCMYMWVVLMECMYICIVISVHISISISILINYHWICTLTTHPIM